MTNKNERLFKPQRGGRCPRGFELKTYKNIRGSGGEQLKKEICYNNITITSVERKRCIIDDMKEGGEYYEMILLLDSERIEKIEKICYNKKAKSLIEESRTRKK